MTREEAIDAARQELMSDGRTKLRSPEPTSVRERARLVHGGHGWVIGFRLEYPEEWVEHEHVLVEVYEPSGEVVVLMTL